MLLTAQSQTATNYIEALDYLARLKKEGRYNENSVAVFTSLYQNEVDILVKQGYFHPENN